jgi:hypothetical protein
MKLRVLLAILMFGLLAACQTREDDPPVIDPEDCPPQAVEAGTCGA